jgi:hypothetical protein
MQILQIHLASPEVITNASFLGSESCTDAHELVGTSYANLLLHPRPHLVASNGVRPAAVTLLGNSELDTLTLGQGDPWLLLSDDTDSC